MLLPPSRLHWWVPGDLAPRRVAHGDALGEVGEIDVIGLPVGTSYLEALDTTVVGILNRLVAGLIVVDVDGPVKPVPVERRVEIRELFNL